MGTQLLPSPLAGDSHETLCVSSVGGTKRRMRGRSAPKALAPHALNHTPHPSCAKGGAIHLLPQGEKVSTGAHP